MANERRMEQLYVLLSEMIADPPPMKHSEEELAKAHHAYIQDLFDRKILTAGGSARDETGKRHAGGMLVIHAGSLAEAEAIGAGEPYFREGQRGMRVIPWQRTWFGD